ncbi:MAG: amidohydrolase [Planctomycetota bacterium]
MPRSFFLIFAVAVASIPACGGKREPAEILFRGGTFHTGEEKTPRAEAVAVRGGRIVFVGTDAEARQWTGPATKVVNLAGATAVPGMTDCHAHLAAIGAKTMTLDLAGSASLDEMLARLKARVERAAAGEWVTGQGWIETFWKPPEFPTRRDLDRVSPRNPVLLFRIDGHGAVANSEALRLAGVGKGTPNPPGGEIVRDASTGDPAGMLVDGAIDLVSSRVRSIERVDPDEAIVRGARRCVEAGWCEIHDAGGSAAEAERIARLVIEGKIRLRIYKAVSGPSPASDALLRQGPPTPDPDGRFRLRAIKIVLDGSLGSRGAALLAPYSDHEGSGLLFHREEDLLPTLAQALRQGVQVETHAIGDRANRMALDVYEKAFAAVPPGERKIREPRWRIEHAQILDPADIPRFARLGVIASMQPSHAISDLHFAPRRLGLERLAGAYAWKSLRQSGAVVAGGSDAPVEKGDPLVEFTAAVARKDLSGFSGPGWHPEQALSRDEALRLFTSAAAYAAFEESDRGTLAPGKRADLTVFSADIMTIPAASIPKARCLMTVIGGDIAYEAKR